jgi:hypothetical protein
MSEFVTVFGSLDRYEKGHVEIIDDEVKHYVFSNVFEIASKAPPYEKTAVGKNLDFVIEAIRAEGTSPWMAASHDEFVVVMDGQVTVELVKLERPDAVAPPTRSGTVRVDGEPRGRRMGRIVLGRGHQALLPAGSAYRFVAARPSVMIQQTLQGGLTRERWAEICLK